MSRRLSRRKVLKGLLSAGAAAALSTPDTFAKLRVQDPNLQIGGQPVELTVSAVSPRTLRIKFERTDPERDTTPFSNDSLVQPDWPGPKKQFRLPEELKRIQLHEFSISFDAESFRLSVEEKGQKIQQLTIDQKTGGLSFKIEDAPLLGFGEGGPQFDRRGIVDQMRSGQGGYRLRTHGGRVPIQWLISTSGWALYLHHPEGTFDLTTGEGKFVPKPNARFPLDVFLVISQDPLQIMGEFARLTGLPEMPPLWSLGYLQS